MSTDKMSTDKMSFNKRIMMVKKTTFEGVTSSKELDSIASTKKQGYYSLKTIFTYLYPALDEYNLDLDLEIMPDKIIGNWYDCLSDKERKVNVDFTELREKMSQVKKLPLMANEVQSDGAEKSYTRRYAYTIVLGLNATDEIENIPNNHSNNNFNSTVDNNKNIGPGGQKYITTDTNKKVSEKQLKRMFAISQKTLLTDEEIKADIKERYNYNSRNDFRKKQYDEYCSYLENLITATDLNKLNQLMESKGKTEEDLNFILEKSGLKGIAYLNKQGLKYLTDRLNKLPDVEGLPI